MKLKFLMAVLAFGLCGIVHAQAYIQFVLNGSTITAMETTQPVFAGLDMQDFADVVAYHWSAERSFDSTTGLPRSNLQADSVRIVKRVGNSSAWLRQALFQNSTLDDVTIKFFGNDFDTGAEIELYEVKLTNAVISGIAPWYSDELSQGLFEAVTINFQSATFTHDPTGAQAQYDFNQVQ